MLLALLFLAEGCPAEEPAVSCGEPLQHHKRGAVQLKGSIDMNGGLSGGGAASGVAGLVAGADGHTCLQKLLPAFCCPAEFFNG